MNLKRYLILLVFLVLVGCAGAQGPTLAPPRLELPTYFYVGTMALNLKSQPDPTSNDAALIRLNERVEMIQRRGSWFLVKTADGRQGWANDKYLELKPVSELYVRRGGVRLKKTSSEGSGTIERLRTNDSVTIKEQNQQGWARVTVARTQSTGWVELSNLSTERVVVRRPVRRTSPQPAAAEPKPEGPPAPALEPPSILTPAPAQAAPPPLEKPKPPAAPRKKVSPEMFEPF